MKRSARVAKITARKMMKTLSTGDQSEAQRPNAAVVTVDPFIVNKNSKISDYYQPTENGSQNEIGTYSCKWQVGIGIHGICKHTSDSASDIVEHIMEEHAGMDPKGFTCCWLNCSAKGASQYQSKLEFVSHVKRHAEAATEVFSGGEAEDGSSDESYDEKNVSDEESDSDDGDDEFTLEKQKTRRSKRSKAKRRRRTSPLKAPTPAKKQPSAKTYKTAEKPVAVVKSSDGNKVSQPLTLTLFRFACNWEVEFAVNKTSPMQKIICNRKFQVMEASIDHLQGHHLSKIGSKGPYKCCWIGCSLRNKSFSTKEELAEHVVVHTGEKVITVSRNIPGDAGKPVQKVVPTFDKPTPRAIAVGKPVQLDVQKVREKVKQKSLTVSPKPSSNVPKKAVSKFLNAASPATVPMEKETEDEEESDIQITINPSTLQREVKEGEKEFESFVNRQLLQEMEQSCINSVLQALLTTSLPTIVKKLCSSGHRCYFCRMLSFTQRAIHSAEGKPIKPFELSLYKEEMGITSGEGDPAEYISKLIGEIIADEKARHHSNDTKYRFMIRFQKKTCGCSMSCEVYHWALTPTKKNESLFDLMMKCKVPCKQCKVLTTVQPIQMPDNLIITLDANEKNKDASVHYPDEWASYNTRYFLAAVIVYDPLYNDEWDAHYVAYCKVFGKWMLYDDEKATKSSSCDALGNKRVRVLVYISNELTPQALQEALVQARSYSIARHMDSKVKKEPLND